MKIDMHFHVVGRGNDIHQIDDHVFFYPEDNNTILTRILYKMVEKTLGEAGAWIFGFHSGECPSGASPALGTYDRRRRMAYAH